MPDYIKLPNGDYLEVTQTVKHVSHNSNSDDDRPSIMNPAYFLMFGFVVLVALVAGSR